jgi:hypothetical protein
MPTETMVVKIAQGGMLSTTPMDAANGWKTNIAPINEMTWSGGIFAISAMAIGAITRQRIVKTACKAIPGRDGI